MTNKHENEYYCSVPEDDLEAERASWDEEFDADEYDSVEEDVYDGESGNREYDSRTLIPEESKSHWFYQSDIDEEEGDDGYNLPKRRMTTTSMVPVPYNLHSDKYQETMEKHAESEQIWQEEFEKQKQQEREELTLREAQSRLAMEQEQQQKIRVKQLEQAHKFWEESYRFEISSGMDEKEACAKAGEDVKKFAESLPTESEGFRQKRIDDEKARIHLEKEKRLKRSQPLKFPHRRNGGGKGKTFEPPSEEVLAARRAAKRHQRKESNRVEEAQRAVEFAANPPQKKEEEEYIPKPKSRKVQDELSPEEVEAKREEQKYIWEAVTKKLETVEDFSDIENTKKSSKKEEQGGASWSMVTKKSKSGEVPIPKVIKMGAAPYRSTHMQRHTIVSTDTDRQKAFGKLADSSGEGGKSLVRTKMCLSVAKGIPCKHGDKCRFAHSQEELQIPTCFFGCNCRLVKQTTSGFFVNSGGPNSKLCTFIHQEETKENFFQRTGTEVTPKPTPKPSRASPPPHR